MINFLLKRAWHGAIILLLVTMITFSLGRVTGSPATLILPIDATDEEIASLEQRLGLDKPLYYQYGLFLRDTVQGDLGRSYVANRAVSSLFWARVPATLQLAGVGLAIVLFVGIPLGVVAALTRGQVADGMIRWFAAIAQATPNFWLAYLLILLFGVWLRWLPFIGNEGPSNLILPALTVSSTPLAGVLRITRSSMLEVFQEDYMFYGRTKGLPNRVLIFKHGLRNALIPVVTYLGVVIVSNFLTGSLVVEVVFAWPGLGWLAFQSVVQRDFPTLQALVLIFAMMYLAANFFVDMSYAFLDPRIRRADPKAGG